VALAAWMLGAAPATGSGDVVGRFTSARQHAQSLRGSIQRDTQQIEGFNGRIDLARARLRALQQSLDVEQEQLDALRGQLDYARGHVVALRAALVRDRQALARQLVASYETPPPDVVSVAVRSRGFADLLERVDDLKRVARENAAAIVRVRLRSQELAVQATRLAGLENHQHRITAAKLIQRDEVARLQIALLRRQHGFVRSRAAKRARLRRLDRTARRLERQLSRLGLDASGGLAYTGAHGGSVGFFPAPGTNYTVGSEPELAARLDALGKALGLHLIGVSGYRSPSHSVAVGGFANDPHTRGQASDTPGIEGVGEGVLNRFGLTRPFGGAAEADHIQLLGSI
jgi:hypothetical protein